MMIVLGLYLILPSQSVNIRGIIYANMDEISHSIKKKALSHASIILLLFQKEGVEEVSRDPMLLPGKAYDASWIGSMTSKPS